MRLSAVRPLVLHDPPDPPKYFVVGGLVFVPLSEPFLMDDFGLLERNCRGLGCFTVKLITVSWNE